MSRASSSSSTNMSHDCLFCCAFNAFLQQHKCYHKLLSCAHNSKSTTGTAMMELQRRESRQQRKTPSPTPNQAKWFIQNDVTRDEIAKMLNDHPVGAFVVRPSKTCGLGSFVLSVRVPVFVNGNGIAHYLIAKTASDRYKFQGDYNEKEWSDIESLIVHHTIMREFLPCTLQMPTNDGDDEDCENYIPPTKQHSSTSTLASSSSTSSSGSRSTRSHSATRSRADDHEILADFLQSIRNQNSPSSSLHQSRPTICC